MAKRRKPGSGNQIGDHLWEGRYSPGGPDGKQSSRNVYGHIPEECEEKLRAGLLGFRVGTPDAPERTAFQKYGGADAGAIMNTEALDIKNDPH